MRGLKNLLFFLIFIQGAFYLFLIPPWQSPDETRHFGYGAILSEEKELRSITHTDINRKIIESMDAFHAWEYQNIPRPSSLPHRLDDVPFFGEAKDVFGRAQLYYLLSSFIIKEIKINGIVNQLYLVRIFSFVLFLFSIYFTYLSAKIVFKDNFLYCLATVSFVAFIPQFTMISTSVNPLNLAVLLETIFIYLMLLSLSNGKKILLLFCPIVIGLGFFNHHSALFMIPPFLVLLSIHFIKSLKNKRELLRIFLILFVIILLFLAIYTFAYHFFPSSLKTIVSQSSIKTRILEIKGFFKYLFNPSSKPVADFFNGFFMSFWYFSGWMRFRYLPDIYSILKLISLLSLLGLFRYISLSLFRKKYEAIINFKSFLILSTACLFILLGTTIKYLSAVEVAQGRFVFPAISAFALLFVFGLKEISPKKIEQWLPIFIIIGFVVLNIYTIFTHLIRVFYFFTNV